MRALKAFVAAAVVLGLTGAALWFFRFDLIILLARAQQPRIEANRPVTWAKGPAAPPMDERPPNVVFILADDLGYTIDEAEVIYWGTCPSCTTSLQISESQP